MPFDFGTGFLQKPSDDNFALLQITQRPPFSPTHSKLYGTRTASKPRYGREEIEEAISLASMQPLYMGGVDGATHSPIADALFIYVLIQ